MNTSLRGFSHPLSPEGKTQLVGPLPWHYAAAIVGINYRTDPAELRKFLPEPYELSAEEPGGVGIWFVNWLSIWDADKDLIYVNPERTQYKEFLVAIRCRFKGTEGIRCPYVWVDNDFAMLRGWFYGFPKRLGRLHFTFDKAGLYDLNPAFGGFGPTTRFGAILEAHGEKLAAATIRLTREMAATKVPPRPFGLPWYNILHFPSTDVNAGGKPLVHQVVTNIADGINFGEAWEAEVESLDYPESAIEELAAIKPREIQDAYYLTYGQTFRGTQVVHDYLK